MDTESSMVLVKLAPDGAITISRKLMINLIGDYHFLDDPTPQELTECFKASNNAYPHTRENEIRYAIEKFIELRKVRG